MFYEVKILDALGNLKKVISSKSLSNKHWSHQEDSPDTKMTLEFDELEDEHSLNNRTVASKKPFFKMDE